VEHDKKWHNYWFIHTLVKKYGLGKGWLRILSELERIRVVRWHKGDISIPEELIPLVENVLQRLDS